MRNSIFLFGALAAAAGCSGEGDTAALEGCGGPGVICTIAGTIGVAARGEEDVPATESSLYLVQDTTVGPDGRLYIMDWNNHRIRYIDEQGLIHTIVGVGELGDGPEGPALNAALNHPTQMTFDGNGDIVFAAWHNSRIMRVDMATQELSFIAGDGTRAFDGDGGAASTAVLDLPSSLVFDESGDRYYISDQANQVIRVVETDGTIMTVAGTPTVQGYADGDALSAQFNGSKGQSTPPDNRIDYAGDGIIIIADGGNHAIREFDVDNGTVTTLAGIPTSAGDAIGPADQAQFYQPADVKVAPDGSIYIADTLNSCIKRLKDGEVDVVAGVCGEYGYEGDEGLATEAILNQPYGIELGPDGTLYIADTFNHVVRAVYPQ